MSRASSTKRTPPQSHTNTQTIHKLQQQTNSKGGVAAWPDVPKQTGTLGNLTPADRHGSVQVRVFQPLPVSLLWWCCCCWCFSFRFSVLSFHNTALVSENNSQKPKPQTSKCKQFRLLIVFFCVCLSVYYLPESRLVFHSLSWFFPVLLVSTPLNCVW